MIYATADTKYFNYIWDKPGDCVLENNAGDTEMQVIITGLKFEKTTPDTTTTTSIGVTYTLTTPAVRTPLGSKPIKRSPNYSEYPENIIVTLNAIGYYFASCPPQYPCPKYVFSHWEDENSNIISGSNPVEVIMNSNKYYQAYYKWSY